MAKPHVSHGMKTSRTMMMNSGAAMPAAVNRMTAASSPAMMYLRSESQYLARLMRPLAPEAGWR
jgi:Na+-transporting NADH:ubiquinone oxidoreductase subunit NqrB